MRQLIVVVIVCLALLNSCKVEDKVAEQAQVDTLFHEQYRPQFHFSPKEKWMNDPNGMVYYKGVYHLFYQHYPDSTVWGPMHWGHATSKDLVHWEHQPIALYPDSLGLIFSGSAVVDRNNSSGFGTRENPPLVAMFTYHSMEKEKAGATDYQNQGIAYSIDDGKTWNKYENNPVLKNQGIKDFRDPKVFWHEESKKWVVVLAVFDHVELWSSADLKSWSKLSEFGKEYGSHGGVWECPDLFQLSVSGSSDKKWVMLVSINPGGPNGGSATQFFIGDFDGKTFKADLDKSTTSWLDYGPDDYAGVTWSNIDNGRKIFLGWMSNWAYANVVPTSRWRSANTIPRDLSLKKVNDRYYVASSISPELLSDVSAEKSFNVIAVNDSLLIHDDKLVDLSKSIFTGTFEAKDFEIELSNKQNQKVTVGFNKNDNRFYIDRSKSGNTTFSDGFIKQPNAPRVLKDGLIKVQIVMDVSSVEVFFDDGLTVMTSVFFPNSPLTDITLKGESLKVEGANVKVLKSIW